MEWMILFILLAIVIYVISIYNALVALRQRVAQAFADVDVHLHQRHDLLPNLVETVKGFAGHERETLTAVISARSAALEAPKGSPVQAAAEAQLGLTIGGLFALAEAYPQLKADENFLRMQDELSVIEDKIAAARRFYNNAVNELNTAIEEFPAILFARALGFSKSQFFEIDAGNRPRIAVAPQVQF
jgi:LemA protein